MTLLINALVLAFAKMLMLKRYVRLYYSIFSFSVLVLFWHVWVEELLVMKKLSALMLLLVALAIVIYAGSPYYTAYQLKAAFDAKDGKSIAAAIDYQQLRPNIKTQLSTRFAQTLSQYPLVAELGGDALKGAADQFIDRAVQGAINTNNIERLIDTQGQANQATKELAAAWAIASNQIDLRGLIQDLIVHRGDVNAVIQEQMSEMMDKQAAELKARAAQSDDDAAPELHYCGMNCFRVLGDIKGYPVAVEMQRQGLISWKVINVVLP